MRSDVRTEETERKKPNEKVRHRQGPRVVGDAGRCFHLTAVSRFAAQTGLFVI